MEPLYVAKKSKICALTFWRVLFFWLIIPTIVILVDMLILSKNEIEFYDNKIIHKSGVINKRTRQMTFGGVYSVSTEQSLFGRMFNYGNVIVDAVGKWDINSQGIKDPDKLVEFLQTKIVAKESLNHVIMD